MSTALLHPRRALLPALALGAAVGLAGCGSSGTSTGAAPASSTPSTPTATVTQTVTPPSSPTASATSSHTGSTTTPVGSTASTSPTSSSSSAPAVPECTAADVSVRLGQSDGAAGTIYYPLVMTNVSGHACRSGGYGGVSLVDGDGHQLGAAAVRESTADARVVPFVLIPNAHATATLGIAEALNYPKATCRPEASSGLRVYVPNETRAKFVRVSGLTACRASGVSLLHLQPYQPVS